MSVMRHREERTKKLAFWRPHISNWRASGISAKSYCQQHNLVLHQFKYWQYEVDKENEKTQPLEQTSDFVEITTVDQSNPPEVTNARIEIKTPYGFNITISDALTRTDLNILLTAIKDLT